MSKFWAGNPVEISKIGGVRQILSAKELLAKVGADISGAKFNLRPTVYLSENLTPDKYDEMLNFINANYIGSGNSYLVYTMDILTYYLTDALIIEFRPEKSEKLVGLIVGRRRNFQINSEVFEILEVNFLCLIKPLRNLHLAPLLISVLTKTCVERFNISIATYTISTKIQSPSIGSKQMYHRPLRIRRLTDAGFFPAYYPQFERQYATFKKLSNFELRYYNGNGGHDMGLCKFVSDYSKSAYSISDIKSEAEITQIFANKLFHNFVFYERGMLKSYVCLYRLDTYNKTKATAFKNGYLFIACIAAEDVVVILNSVAEYCYKKDIFDVLTLSDIFAGYDYDSDLQYMRGTGSLSYYIFNMAAPVIENHKNGIVAI